MKKQSFLLILVLFLCSTFVSPQTNKQLTSDEKGVLLGQMLSDGAFGLDKELALDCFEQASKSADILEINFEDINHDGKPELYVYGRQCACLGSRRCALWIYRKIGNRYELLLGSIYPEDIRPLKTSNKGYPDLRITEVSGPSSFEGTTFRFDGKQYKKK